MIITFRYINFNFKSLRKPYLLKTDIAIHNSNFIAEQNKFLFPAFKHIPKQVRKILNIIHSQFIIFHHSGKTIKAVEKKMRIYLCPQGFIPGLNIIFFQSDRF